MCGVSYHQRQIQASLLQFQLFHSHYITPFCCRSGIISNTTSEPEEGLEFHEKVAARPPGPGGLVLVICCGVGNTTHDECAGGLGRVLIGCVRWGSRLPDVARFFSHESQYITGLKAESAVSSCEDPRSSLPILPTCFFVLALLFITTPLSSFPHISLIPPSSPQSPHPLLPSLLPNYYPPLLHTSFHTAARFSTGEADALDTAAADFILLG